MLIQPKLLSTRISDDDGNHDNDVSTAPAESNCQPFSHSAINYDATNPIPPPLGGHCDTDKDKKDHVMPLSNGGTNALELLMGQYHDSDSELEPGEIL